MFTVLLLLSKQTYTILIVSDFALFLWKSKSSVKTPNKKN